MNDPKEKEPIDVDIISETFDDIDNALAGIERFGKSLEELSPKVAETSKKAAVIGKKASSLGKKAKRIFEIVKENTVVKERPIIPR